MKKSFSKKNNKKHNAFVSAIMPHCVFLKNKRTHRVVKKILKFVSGFTLIELLVVIAIVGILASVTLSSLNSARSKSANAAIKSDLANVRSQAELIHNPDSGYSTFCSNADVVRAMTAADEASGGVAVCNNTIEEWAIASPLKVAEGGNTWWCVDGGGSSRPIPTALSTETVCPDSAPSGSPSALSVPSLTTPTVSSITNTGAIIGATITSDGGASITERGTCWGLVPDPSTNCVPDGEVVVGEFGQVRSGMPSATLIYYNGYAINSEGVGYSESGSFTTDAGFIVATGGTITTVGNYKVHTFASTGGSSFSVTSNSAAQSIEYLIVGGGGGGGGANTTYGGRGGGGGAGGVLTGTMPVTSGSSYSVWVGSGGAAGLSQSGVGGTSGASGGNSVLQSAGTASGGGGGGGGCGSGGLSGGSGGGGGGGGGCGSGAAGGSGVVGQGNAGGASGANTGGGGGGAGSAGTSGATNGARGAGLSSSITGSPVFYGIGGYGGSWGGSGNNNGTPASGYGGGGGGAYNTAPVSAAGNAGVVIIRYQYQ